VITEPETETEDLPELHHQPHRLGAVLVAAGSSSRMGGVDKTLAVLAGQPVVAYSLGLLAGCPLIDCVAVVCNDENRETVSRLATHHRPDCDIRLAPGGPRRRDSVMNGLLALPSDVEWVLVHDAARPLVTFDLVVAALAGAQETGAAVCALEVTDTIKLVDDDHLVVETPPRSQLWAAQTPQVFRTDLLREAHLRTDEDASDDAWLVEQAGVRVRVVAGSPENLKITRPADLVLAEALLAARGGER
jgi:2-C-methyl-D-erythritol 4-phosphate cytidylyltransferase